MAWFLRLFFRRHFEGKLFYWRCEMSVFAGYFSCPCFTPCELILDGLGISILGREFWIPGTGFQVLDSSLPVLDSGFLELYSGFQSPGFLILQAKISRTPKSRFSHKGLPVVLWSEVSFWPVNCFKITCTFLLLLEFLVRRNYHNLPQVSLLSLSTAAVRIWRVYWMELKKNKGAWQGEVNMCKKERKER